MFRDMKKTYAFFLSVVVLFFVGCAAVPPTIMAEPEKGIVAINLAVWTNEDKLLDLIMGDVRYPVAVFFVKLSDGSGPSDAEEEELVVSNHISQDRAYLLNADPGRYVAVAARLDFVRDEERFFYTAYLPKGLITATEVTVGPGEVGFMGEYQVKEPIIRKGMDDAQSYYAKAIEPPGHTFEREIMLRAGQSKPLHVISTPVYVRLALKDAKRERGFLKKAAKDLLGTAFAEIITRRTKELSRSSGE